MMPEVLRLSTCEMSHDEASARLHSSKVLGKTSIWHCTDGRKNCEAMNQGLYILTRRGKFTAITNSTKIAVLYRKILSRALFWLGSTFQSGTSHFSWSRQRSERENVITEVTFKTTAVLLRRVLWRLRIYSGACAVNTRYMHTLGTPKMCACNVAVSVTH